jgi:hypothetical protein
MQWPGISRAQKGTIPDFNHLSRLWRISFPTAGRPVDFLMPASEPTATRPRSGERKWHIVAGLCWLVQPAHCSLWFSTPPMTTPSRRLLEELRAATLESRLEELGVLSPFSVPRVSNKNRYTESLFRRAKYLPDCCRKPLSSKDQACQWFSAFADSYNHRHLQSGIKFVTPQQRHSGQVLETFQDRAAVFEEARLGDPIRWSRSIYCWCQPEVAWICPPPAEIASKPATFTIGPRKEATALSCMAVTGGNISSECFSMSAKPALFWGEFPASHPL